MSVFDYVTWRHNITEFQTVLTFLTFTYLHDIYLLIATDAQLGLLAFLRSRCRWRLWKVEKVFVSDMIPLALKGLLLWHISLKAGPSFKIMLIFFHCSHCDHILSCTYKWNCCIFDDSPGPLFTWWCRTGHCSLLRPVALSPHGLVRLLFLLWLWATGVDAKSHINALSKIIPSFPGRTAFLDNRN